MKIRTLLKPLSFLPALLLMYLIFSFSAQDGVTSSELSYKVSYKIIEIGGKVLDADFTPEEIDSLAGRFEGVVRKLAHMAEYFALAAAVAFPLYVYGLRGIVLMIAAGLFCVGFACTDEYHQAFVSGRSPSKKDVLIDSFGVFWGLLLARIIGWIGSKTIFRRSGTPRNPAGPEQVGRQAPAFRAHPGQRYQGQPYPPQGQPYRQTHPPQQSRQEQPTYADVSYYPPRRQQNSPRYDAARGPGYPQAQQPCYRQPYPSGGAPRSNVQEEPSTSDRLSEDMSFRKLVHNLREQKKEKKSDR